MPNYRLHLDLSDFSSEFLNYDLSEFRSPFCLYFIEASDPDDACSVTSHRIVSLLLKEDESISTRILCRKIRKYMRIDRIDCL
jgi:hypothetical protein